LGGKFETLKAEKRKSGKAENGNLKAEMLKTESGKLKSEI
jgi:hypothetical protein